MPDKLQAITDWPTPHCLRDVRAFFGLASYYRQFVRNFATIAEPLTRLTKKNNTPFKWTDGLPPIERSPLGRNNLSLSHRWDSLCPSYRRIRCRHWRRSADAVETPIAFYSRVMNSAQRNYCPTRRELLAVVAALQHFRHYLLGSHIILRTDHRSLKDHMQWFCVI